VWKSLGKFDHAVSNPPFGQIGQDKAEWVKYTGVADLMAVAVAMQVSKSGTFILPQMSLPFKYSGECSFTRQDSMVFNRFKELFPNIEIHCSSTDTSVWANEWVDASPKVEIVNIEKTA